MNYIEKTAAEIRDQIPDDLLPAEEDLDELFRLYALLARTKGEAVTAEDVHDAWATWTINRGEDHESVKPYSDLDPSTRREDNPFVDAIRAVARGR